MFVTFVVWTNHTTRRRGSLKKKKKKKIKVLLIGAIISEYFIFSFCKLCKIGLSIFQLLAEIVLWTIYILYTYIKVTQIHHRVKQAILYF